MTRLRRVFILCQGEQQRLSQLGYPKQLVKIGPEMLLERTIRQIRSHPTTADAIIEVIGRPPLACAVYPPGDTRALLRVLHTPGLCVVDGLGETLHPTWIANHTLAGLSYRFIVLLGDVVWTDPAIASLLSDPRELVFAGTSDLSRGGGETFGLAFTDIANMRQLIATCPCRVNRLGQPLSLGKQQRGGHLRRLLWHAMAERHLAPPDPRKTWAPEIYLPIDDDTDDIDTIKDVQALPRLVERLYRSGDSGVTGRPPEAPLERCPDGSVVVPTDSGGAQGPGPGGPGG
ncbi:MAG TPA: hypothetical protein VFD36_29545 [Kofleriaceae bacterium]|nr:hypothetical protein [Kofleriaceae bacterium]